METEIVNEFNFSVLASCCSHRGTANLHAVLEKNAYSVGDEAIITYILDSKNMKDDIFMEISLVRLITLSSNRGESACYEKTIFRNRA